MAKAGAGSGIGLAFGCKLRELPVAVIGARACVAFPCGDEIMVKPLKGSIASAPRGSVCDLLDGFACLPLSWTFEISLS